MHRRRPWFTIGMTVLMLGSIGIAAVHAEEAKSPQANWENLKQLAPGQQIRVVLNDAKTYTGQLHSVSDEGLVIRTAGGEQTVDRQNVLRVSTKGQSHRLRNAALGAAIGVGLGAILAASTSRNDSESQAIGWVVIPPFAGAAGAGVGAFLPTGGWHDVYRAR